MVLNLPLLSEVTRKYWLQYDEVFLVADLIAACTFLTLMVWGKIRPHLPVMFYALSLLFLFWVFIQQAVSGGKAVFFLVGVRAAFFPLVYLFVSAYYISRFDDAVRLLFYVATGWVLVAGAVGIMQILLGPNNPINAVWGKLGLGVGDYTGMKHGPTMKGLFRPTSIFTHTGQFGQVAFLLILFRWTVLAFAGLKFRPWAYVLILADLITISVSGQRAAFLFLSTSVLVMACFLARAGRAAFLKWLFVVAAFGAIVTTFVVFQPTYGGVILSRFESVIQEIPSRLHANLVDSTEFIFQHYLFLGKGLGYFTLGAQRFGGKLVYEDVGVGESSINRICCEVGVLGAMILGAMWVLILVRAVATFRARTGSGAGTSSLFYFLWLISMYSWCNTADVFANTVSTFAASALGGALLLPVVYKHREMVEPDAGPNLGDSIYGAVQADGGNTHGHALF
jgi:hypothetical protein